MQLVDKGLAVLWLHGAEGRAVGLVHHAHGCEGCLDGDRVGLDEEEIHESVVFVEEFTGFYGVALHGESHELGEILRDYIGKDGYAAVATEKVGEHGDVVVAAVNLEAFGTSCYEGGNVHEVACGLLDADDVLEVVRQAEGNVGFNGRASASGDVVEYYGDVDCLGDCGKVEIHACGGGLIVVGTYGEDGVDARLGGVTGVFDATLGAVGARASDDDHAMVDILDGVPEHLRILLFGECRCLARCAADDYASSTVGKVEVEETVVGFVVYGAIFLEWRHEGGNRALEIELSHVTQLYFRGLGGRGCRGLSLIVVNVL